MLKKIITMALMLTGMFSISPASAQQGTPLPLNPAVKHGTLDNGLNYYILHNEEPKNRANFYIAQKVGAALETPEQSGLAHFLEHMAFNGSTHYPGKTMLEYLQSKGIRFGADINAYTSFDETVYNINNVPCDDKALMDSVLLVLADWSNGISLLDEEIDAERGVIVEEWRSRDNAVNRMYTQLLPVVYNEFAYQHMPIGSMDVIRNFPYQAIKDYYHKWYRPDQQGIVIVGDFDVDEMEAKVKEMFSAIEMPENPAERVYTQVSDNEKPIFFAFQDPETQYHLAQICFKSDKTPFEMRNTIEGFMGDELLQSVCADLINNRLEEFSKKPECRYTYAGAQFGDFLVSKTKDAFTVIVMGKDADMQGAIADAMGIVVRACKTGFTDSELERVKSDILSNYEKEYNERDKTKTEVLARKLIRHFVDNTPNPGAEISYQLVQSVFPMLPVQAINEMMTQIITPENQVIIVQQPQIGESVLPAEEAIVGTVEQAINATYEAYEDEKIDKPLISKYAKPGKIKSAKQNQALGTTEFILSNGVRVVVKPTDFASDEIRMQATSQSGKQIYSQAEAPNVLMLETAAEASKLGNFSQTLLTKYLAGKKVSLSYQVGNRTTYIEGKSTVKDLETLLDLTYASFTAVSPDQEEWNAVTSQMRTLLAQQDKNPNVQFSRGITKAQFGNNALGQDLTVADIDKANYAKCLDMVKKSVSNAADYTFYFVGNVDVEKLKPMLEKYIASLPSKGKAQPAKVVTDMTYARGDETIAWDQPMQSPATMIYDIQSDFNVPFNVKNNIYGPFVGQILDIIFTETIREEMGGAYSPQAGSYLNGYTNSLHLLYVIGTSPEMKQAVLDRAALETNKLLQEGASPEQFRKVKEAAIKQYENRVRTNDYWMNQLINLDRGWNLIDGYEAALKGATLEDFNAFMKTLTFAGNNRLVIMTGVSESK